MKKLIAAVAALGMAVPLAACQPNGGYYDDGGYGYGGYSHVHVYHHYTVTHVHHYSPRVSFRKR